LKIPEESMSLTTCPKCGKFNAFSSTQCPDCGASLEEEDRPKPGRIAELWSLLTEKCVQEIWCIVIGIILILMGIFVPQLGSAILQLVAVFTEEDYHMRRNIEETTPSAGDGWLVIGIGLIFTGFGVFGIYANWEKSHRSVEEKPQPQDDSRSES
jgi:uncharacterized membrane protein